MTHRQLAFVLVLLALLACAVVYRAVQPECEHETHHVVVRFGDGTVGYFKVNGCLEPWDTDDTDYTENDKYKEGRVTMIRVVMIVATMASLAAAQQLKPNERVTKLPQPCSQPNVCHAMRPDGKEDCFLASKTTLMPILHTPGFSETTEPLECAEYFKLVPQ